MAAVRNIVREFSVPLDYKRDFRLRLPSEYLEDESARTIELWTGHFHASVNSACQSRRSRMLNASMKRTVFASAMDNVCKDFSRRTETVKVVFENKLAKNSKSPQKAVYSLRILKLSAIPEDVRDAGQYFVAEIPPREAEARAERVGFVQRDTSDTMPIVVEEVSGQLLPNLIPESELQSNMEATHSQFILEPSPVNPPVASVVAIEEQVETDSDDEDPQMEAKPPKTVLERMQELESIRQFLSAQEYESARQSIIRSI